MPSATITSKGQITLPKDVRTSVGVGAGDRVEFVRLEDGHFAIVPATGTIRSLKGLLPKREAPASLADRDDAIVAGASGA